MFLFKILKNKSPITGLSAQEQFHKEGHRTLQKIPTKFLFLKLSITFAKIRFSWALLLIEWNNLDQDLKNSGSYSLFPTSILKSSK